MDERSSMTHERKVAAIDNGSLSEQEAGVPYRVLDAASRHGVTCDCGNGAFHVFTYGAPSADDPRPQDPGLRRIYTCTRCGDQLRLYQASQMRRPATAPTGEEQHG